MCNLFYQGLVFEKRERCHVMRFSEKNHSQSYHQVVLWERFQRGRSCGVILNDLSVDVFRDSYLMAISSQHRTKYE